MKTIYKALLIILAIGLLAYFIGGASALSALLYVLAYLSIFAIIFGIGALSGNAVFGGIILICSIAFGAVCYGGASFLDNYSDKQKTDKEYNELMYKSHSIAFNEDDNTLRQMISLSKSTKDEKQSQALKDRVKNVCDSLYRIAEKSGTIHGWEMYQKLVPPDYFKDSSEKIEELTAIEWNTDSKAWKQASSSDTVSSYDKYLSMYPHGKYAREAEKRIVDIGIARTDSEEHGSLPQMDRVSTGNGPKSLVNVSNSTSYTLTLLYSGADSKRLVIAPHKSASISLHNGTYKVAAFVSASNVRRYAGTEQLLGGDYSVSYYISSY